MRPVLIQKGIFDNAMIYATKSFNMTLIILKSICGFPCFLKTFFVLNGVHKNIRLYNVDFFSDKYDVFYRTVFDIVGGYWIIQMSLCNISNEHLKKQSVSVVEEKASFHCKSNKSISMNNSTNGMITIEKCYFSWFGARFSIASGMVKVDIKESFFNQTILRMDGYQKAMISDSTFSSAPGYFNDISYVSFRNISVKNTDLLPPLGYPAQMTFKNIGDITINNTSFQTAIYGALEVSNCNISIVNSTFINNTQKQLIEERGNLQFTNSNVNLTDCHLENNTANSFVAATLSVINFAFKDPLHKYKINNTVIIAGVNYKYKINPVIKISYTDEVKSHVFGNTSVSCPWNYFLDNTPPLEKEYFNFIFFCIECDIKHYNLQEQARMIYNSSTGQFDVHNITCMPCPYGAICDSGIRSKGNYWGYLNKDRHLVFIHCPTSYCCLSDKCQSYNSCNEHRKGRLCSQCEKGYSLSFFGNFKCIKDNQCIGTLFWTIYSLISLLYLAIFLYLEDIILFVKRAVQYMNCKSNHGDWQFTSNITEESEIFTDQDDHRHSPFIFLIPNDETNVDNYVQESSTTSGIIKILFFFYQTASIIRADTSTKLNFKMPVFADVLTSFFSIRIDLQSPEMGICAMKNASVLQIEIIKTGCLLIPLSILLFFLLFDTMFRRAFVMTGSVEEMRTYKIIDSNIPSYSKLPFRVRAMCTCFQLMLVGYSTITLLIFKSIHCVTILDDTFLYVEATTKCYTKWQLAVFMLFPTWVVPFPLSLYFGSKLLRNCYITPNQFLVSIFIPLFSLWFFVRARKRELIQEDAICSLHLLNVGNLPFRTISDTDIPLEWEPVLILRRVFLVACAIFIPSSIIKLYPIGMLLFLILFHHMIVKPYKENVLNYVELVSLLSLCFLNMLNIFWAFTDELEIKNSVILYTTGKVFIYGELCILLTPICVILVYLVFGKIILKQYLCKQE